VSLLPQGVYVFAQQLHSIDVCEDKIVEE